MQIKNLSIRAGDSERVLVDKFTGEISHQLIALVGLNGTGKSTLLQTLSGLKKVVFGEIKIDGINYIELPVNEKAKLSGVVFSSQENIPWMDVYSFIATGRSPYTGYFGQLNEKDHQVIEKVMTKTGLSEFKNRYFSELSDGEKQRCLIAQSLVQETPFLFLDEPTAFLDVKNKKQILELLREIQAWQGISIVFSTHDIHLACKYADVIWWIDNKEIKIMNPADFSESLFE